MRIGATLFDFAMDRRFGVLRLRPFLICAIAGASCLAAASARADEAHGHADAEHASAARADAGHAVAGHVESGRAEPVHAEGAHGEAPEARPTATEKPFFSKTAEDLIREKQRELEEAAARGDEHGEADAEGEHHEDEAGAHGEEAGEDEARGADPIALELERLAGDPSSFAVKATIQTPAEGNTLLTDVVLYWITPGGAAVVLPLKPVTESVLAAKIQGPLEEGAHRIMLSAAVRGEDGFVQRLLERAYAIDAPNLEPKPLASRTLAESKDGIEPLVKPAAPAGARAAGGASIFRIVAGLLLGVLATALLLGAAWAGYLMKMGALKMGALKIKIPSGISIGKLLKFRRGAGARAFASEEAAAETGVISIQAEAPAETGEAQESRAETARAAAQLLGEQTAPEPPQPVTDDARGEPQAVDLSNSAF